MKNQKTSDSRRPDSGRRDFLRRSGTVVSAMLAPAAVSLAGTGTGERPTTEDRPGADVALLEDEAEIRRLYQDYAARIASDPSSAESAPLRLMHDPAQPGETITVAPDRRTATARFHCLAQMAVPLEGDGSLLDMARLQGQHKRTWWESGVHELDCVKSGAGWKISGVMYRKAEQQDGGRLRAAASIYRRDLRHQ